MPIKQHMQDSYVATAGDWWTGRLFLTKAVVVVIIVAIQQPK
jgi:hypothetical protein